MQGKTAPNTKIISPIKNGIIDNFEDAQIMLKELIKKVLPKSIVKK